MSANIENTVKCSKCGGSGHWMNKPQFQCFTCKGTGNYQEVPALIHTWIDMVSVRNHMRLAIEKGISKPILRLLGVAGGKVEFSLAPEIGKNPGCIYIRYNGEYAGKIDKDGNFFPVKDCTAEIQHDIISAALSNITENVKLYGRRTGHCSCCGLTLTNSKSIELGIGPICRDKWEL